MSGTDQLTDSLSTAIDVPLSGNGTSTPEGSAGNADYSAWQWEAVLATVLSIPVPDRGEVTGQPWLTVSHDGQDGPGSHLIWTAGWNTGQNSGATSIQVYLSPDLYTAGGAWDRFLNAPPQELSGVPSRQYAGLPLVPPSFDAASLVVASAANFWQSAAQQLTSMHNDATSGPIVGFQGNLASVAGELLGRLQTVTAGLHEQMTEPVDYAASIEAAGGSAVTFLADVLAAYSSWAQLAEHSPLGSVVTVLEQIATRDPGGGYVIPDPRNTPFGDLTVDSSWAVVEQHAKDLWTGTLTGGTAGFTGLDLLGRTALSKMISQFAATTSALVPVVGPAPPDIQQNPVNTPLGGGGPGNSFVHIPPPGGGGTGGPGFPPPPSLLIKSPGPGGPGGLGGPGGPGVLGLGGPGGPGGPSPDDPGDFGGHFGAGGALGGPAPAPPGGNTGPAPFAAASLLAAGPPGSRSPAGSIRADGTTFAVPGHEAVSLSSPAGPGSLAHEPAGSVLGSLGPAGFSGAIGRPAVGGGNEDRRRKDLSGRPGHGRKAVTAAPLTAPAAGFSIGRGPGGVALERSAVPTIAARPPTVTSSAISVQPVQVPGGTVTAAAGSPGGGPAAAALPAVPSAASSAVSSAAPPAVPPAGTQAPAEGMGGIGGMGGMGRMGGMGGGPGRGPAERQRLAYLPQEPRYWGTEEDLAASSLGAAAGDDDRFAEEDFDAVPQRIAGIGARSESGQREEAATDWRML